LISSGGSNILEKMRTLYSTGFAVMLDMTFRLEKGFGKKPKGEASMQSQPKEEDSLVVNLLQQYQKISCYPPNIHIRKAGHDFNLPAWMFSPKRTSNYL
jgi:hypothetical protein